MHLNYVSWLKKWLLRKEGTGKNKAWLTVDNVKVKPSHVNLGGGCLYVPKEDNNEFHAKYLKYVLIAEREMNLTEQPLVFSDGNSYSPVIVDVDLRYSAEGVT